MLADNPRYFRTTRVSLLNVNFGQYFSIQLKMPVDSRRLQGPDSAIDYRLLKSSGDDLEAAVSQIAIKDCLIQANGTRNDQRTCSDARKLCKF